MGNALGSCCPLMTLETQMTLTLLQQLLMALRANDGEGLSDGIGSYILIDKFVKLVFISIKLYMPQKISGTELAECFKSGFGDGQALGKH